MSDKIIIESYADGLRQLGWEVLVDSYVGSYQGDYIAAVYKNGEFGHVFFGFGSCSGCDWLEAADIGSRYSQGSVEEHNERVADFLASLERELRVGSREAVIEGLNKKRDDEIAATYFGDEKELNETIDNLINAVRNYAE